MTRIETGERERSIAFPRSHALVLIEGAAITLLIFMGVRWSLRPEKGLLDWGSFIASGDAASKGLDPYGVYDLTFRVGPALAPAPNLNPPISIYPFQFAALFDPAVTYHAWYALSLLMVATAVGLLWWAYPRERTPEALWAFALGGLWHTLELGQLYAPLALAATVGWLLLRERDDWRAGVAIGLVASLKPQFLAWPALLLLGRHWRSAGAGFGTFALAWTIPLVLQGRSIYEEWFAATPPLLDPIVFAGNSSLLAVGARLGVTELALALNVVVGLGAVAGVAWFRPSRESISAAALILALVTGPITWPGYTMVLLPVLFAMGWRRVMPAVVLLAFPYWAVIWLDVPTNPEVIRFFAETVYFLGVAALTAMFAWDRWSGARAEPHKLQRGRPAGTRAHSAGPRGWFLAGLVVWFPAPRESAATSAMRRMRPLKGQMRAR